MPAPRVLLTCEHGGNRVPPAYRRLFRGKGKLLASHRGHDPGALRLARALHRLSGWELLACTVTRLLVEPNRSLGHPRLFSEVTRGLPERERARLLERYWRPHRDRVHAAIARRPGPVLHLGVHTFTPVLDGHVRTMDVGLLYDPARRRERALCARWRDALRKRRPDLRVRRNAPYRGAADGLTTTLRRRFAEARYTGVELEVNQALFRDGRWRGLADDLHASLLAALR
jgi:predicted N-formylglutamate amidohydrolase